MKGWAEIIVTKQQNNTMKSEKAINIKSYFEYFLHIHFICNYHRK